MRSAPLDTGHRRRRRLIGALALTLAVAGVAARPGLADPGQPVPPSTTAVTPPSTTAAAPAPPATTPTPTAPATTTAPPPATPAAAPPPPVTTAAPSTAVGRVVGAAVAVAPHAARAVAPRRRPLAHAAATTAVTIRDFSFEPGAITIHVGDTVTWSNAGPTAHTATGPGFDTGILSKGRSGSHTFRTAGTFAYHCTLHPFMKGTVVVVAAAAGGTGGGSGTSAAPTGRATPATPAAPIGAPATSSATGTTGNPANTLPHTGIDTLALAALGALTLLLGLALRKATRPR